MTIIDQALVDKVSSEAKASPRLRMNYNFHLSLEDKCHRMLNAVEPGSDIPIDLWSTSDATRHSSYKYGSALAAPSVHRHPDKDESFVVLRGKVRSTTYKDDGTVIESVVLSQEDGLYGVDIPKGVWHKLESLESGSVVFECKEGPFVPHEVDGILDIEKK